MPAVSILLGREAAARALQEIDALGIARLMVVCGPRIGESMFLADTVRTLGRRVVETFDRVPPHPTLETLQEGAAAAGRVGVDGLVCVGGGSVVDAAKGISAMRAAPGLFDRDHSRISLADAMPIIAYPTTCSGAEMTPGGTVLTPEGRKRQFRHMSLAPRVVVGSAAGLRETPPDVLMTTGMNGLAHCIEGLYSKRGNPISSALAIEGIRRFMRALPAALDAPGDDEILLDLRVASTLGGMVIVNARVGIHHAICHTLGSRTGISHGVANAVVLPAAMRFNLPAAPEPLADAATAMGLPHEPERAIEAVRALQERIRVPQRLRDVGIDHTALRTVAEDVLSEPGSRNNPRSIQGVEDVMDILEAAW